MSAPQSTPGPWIFNETRSSRGLLAITTADCTQNIADVFGLPLAEVGHANAALIARAPDLLAECERLRAALADVNAYFVTLQDMQPDSQHGTVGERVRAAVRAALASK